MASIEKRDQAYRVRCRDPDGQARSRKCPDKATALALKRDIERAVALGHRWQLRDDTAPPTLFEILNAYITAKAQTLKPDVAERYARCLDLFMRWIKQRSASRDTVYPEVLSMQLLRDFRQGLETGRHNRGRTSATKRKIIEVVQLAWKWAYDEDQFQGFIPAPRRIEFVPEPAKRTVAPTWEEIQSCIAACETLAFRQRAILLAYTGLRVQQAMRLTWDDIDLDAQTLTIRGELGKSTKEQKGRVLPLSKHLCRELSTWNQDGVWVLPSGRSGHTERLARARDMARAWRRAGVRPEVWAQRPHHAFRKGFVSGLRKLGADSDAVEFLVGHDLEIRGVYTDPDALPLRSAVELIPLLTASTPELRCIDTLADGRTPRTAADLTDPPTTTGKVVALDAFRGRVRTR